MAKDTLAENLADEVAKDVAVGRRRNKGELLLAAGYSATVAAGKPAEPFKTEVFKEAMASRGFSIEAADGVVESILHKPEARDGDRLKAADMVYERLGAKAPERTVAMTITADVKDFADYEAIALKYDEEMRAKLLGP